MNFLVSDKSNAFSSGGAGPIAVVGFTPTWHVVISWLLGAFHNVIWADSAEKLAEAVRGTGPGTIIVPSDRYGVRAMKSLKKKWPGARLVMLFWKASTDNERRAAINAIADGRHCGAFLVKAAKGMKKLARFLGIKGADDIVHDYRLVEFIAAGGFGEVWIGENVNTGAFCAVKIVYAGNGVDGQQFEAEFRAVQRYYGKAGRCANSVRIQHVGRDRGSRYFFYVMDLADDLATGRTIYPKVYMPKTLRSLLEGGKPLAPNEAISHAKAILDALSELHTCGLLHEDIKPDNLVFVDGKLKLADIGLLTFVGQIPPASTPGYSPPEGPKGKYRDDTYAVGKVLYVMLTGRDPRELDSFQVEALQPSTEGESASVWTIIAKACAKAAEDRYQSAAEMKEDLEKIASV